MGTWLVRVCTPRLCAGVIMREARVVAAAPILHWSIGMYGEELARWAVLNNGEAKIIAREQDGE